MTGNDNQNKERLIDNRVENKITKQQKQKRMKYGEMAQNLNDLIDNNSNEQQ